MKKYVKPCGECKKINPEHSDICVKCNTFLGSQVPEHLEIAACPACGEDNHAACSNCCECGESLKKDEGPVTVRIPPCCRLEMSGSKCVYTVQSGWIIGQRYHTNSADIQIPIEANPGVKYIHRRHVKIDYVNGKWTVTAIPNPDFTNPTCIGTKSLKPGESCPVQDGERLTLGETTFTVRIVG